MAVLFLALLVCAFSIPAAAVTTSTEEFQVQASKNDEDASMPFTLVDCSIDRGEIDVATNVLIQLDFEKNVVNISVLENNRSCFHLVDAEGKSVAIQVIFPDDQLQKEAKRTIFIQPVEPLSELSAYVLSVDNNLLAKNGTHIDQAYQVDFTTGTAQAAQENEVFDSLGDNIIVYESNTPMNERSLYGSIFEENAAYYDPYASYAQSLPDPEVLARVIGFFVIFLGVCTTAARLWTRRKCV